MSEKPRRVSFVYPGFHREMCVTCDNPDKFLVVSDVYTVFKEVEHDDHIDLILKGFKDKRFHESFFRNKGDTEHIRVSPAAHHYLVGKSAKKVVDRALKALKHCEKRRINFEYKKKRLKTIFD